MPRHSLLLVITAAVAAATIAGLIHFLPTTHDGSSPARAVVLHVPEDKQTDAEWEWWHKHYPDAGLLPIMHSMEGHYGHIYSHYLLATSKGQKEIWFATNMRDE